MKNLVLGALLGGVLIPALGFGFMVMSSGPCGPVSVVGYLILEGPLNLWEPVYRHLGIGRSSEPHFAGKLFLVCVSWALVGLLIAALCKAAHTGYGNRPGKRT